MEKNAIVRLVQELYAVTQEQATALVNKDVDRFLILSDQRQGLIERLISFSQQPQGRTILAESEFSQVLQAVMSLDQKNAAKITQMMKTTQDQLKQMTTGKTAFYAYAGRTEAGLEESHFFDKQQA